MADRKGILRIDPEMLKTLLHLPEDVKIESVLWDVATDTVLFKLSGGALPFVAVGGPIPDVKATVTQHTIAWSWEKDNG